MWNKVVSRGKLSALALFLSLPGCTAISDCKYEVSQKVRTSQAWHEFDGCQDECFTCDYQSGWKAGYYDVITGGTGCPPVIAPKKYWKPPVVFEHDPCRRNDWYCGFQDGAACAKCQPDYHYLQTFMPGPAHCKPQCVSHGTVVSEPTEFPVEHLGAPPAEPMTAPAEGQVEQAPAATTETAPAATAPETAPMPMPEGAVPPAETKPEQEYNKDPEPSSSQSDTVPADFISRGLVRTNGTVPPETRSLLQQLVFNATQLPSEKAEESMAE